MQSTSSEDLTLGGKSTRGPHFKDLINVGGCLDLSTASEDLLSPSVLSTWLIPAAGGTRTHRQCWSRYCYLQGLNTFKFRFLPSFVTILTIYSSHTETRSSHCHFFNISIACPGAVPASETDRWVLPSSLSPVDDLAGGKLAVKSEAIPIVEDGYSRQERPDVPETKQGFERLHSSAAASLSLEVNYI